jgi:enoyl-CoA hydratase
MRFCRPAARNPLSTDVIERLDREIDTALDGGVRKLVFTGTDDVFASGADLREIAELNDTTARAFAERGQALMNKIASLPIPTIAAINGYCFGGALDLSLACDMRIASPQAEFSHPGANLGIMTGWGGTQRLPRLVGEAAALEMFFTAKRVGAHEALRIGLIDSVADDPLAAAIAL